MCESKRFQQGFVVSVRVSGVLSVSCGGTRGRFPFGEVWGKKGGGKEEKVRTDFLK